MVHSDSVDTGVVKLCGDAADKCPITPPHVKGEHWGLMIRLEKSDLNFRALDEIGERITNLVKKESNSSLQICARHSPGIFIYKLRWDFN